MILTMVTLGTLWVITLFVVAYHSGKRGEVYGRLYAYNLIQRRIQRSLMRVNPQQLGELPQILSDVMLDVDRDMRYLK